MHDEFHNDDRSNNDPPLIERAQARQALNQDALIGHDNRVLRATAIRYCEPNPAIGPIYSADSNNDLVKTRRSALRRIVYGLILGFICGGWFGVIPLLERGPLDPLWYSLGVLCLGGWMYYVWQKTRQTVESSYVGQHGIERHIIRDGKTATPNRDVLLFADTTALRVTQKRLILQGTQHVATQFEYVWSDAARKQRFAIAGIFGALEPPLKQGHTWHFAQQAEWAWTEFVYQRLLEAYQRLGYMEFTVQKNAVIRIGDGYLEYRTADRAVRIPAADLATAELVDGQFTFTAREPARFGNSGKIIIRYRDLANAQAFVRALEQFLQLDADDFIDTAHSLAIGIIGATG